MACQRLSTRFLPPLGRQADRLARTLGAPANHGAVRRANLAHMGGLPAVLADLVGDRPEEDVAHLLLRAARLLLRATRLLVRALLRARFFADDRETLTDK